MIHNLIFKSLKFTTVLSLLIVFVKPVWSQDAYPDWENFINNDDASAIAQEGKFLWVGTNNLVKIDTTTEEKTFFNSANSKIPFFKSVNVIAVDSKGNKWIGTSNGLIKYTGSNWEVYNTSNSDIPTNNILTIAIGDKDTVWTGGYSIFTGNEGMAKFDGQDTWVNYDTSNSELPSNKIEKIFIDNNGRKYIGTRMAGLAMISNNTWIIYDTDNSGLPEPRIDDIAADNFGNIWLIGSINEGPFGHYLAKFNGKNDPWNTVYDTSNSGLAGPWLRSLAIDDQNKWIGTNKGLSMFDGNNWTTYDKNDLNISEDSYDDILIGDHNNKWVATDTGMAKYDGKSWKFLNTSDSDIPANKIQTLIVDNEGEKWLGYSSRGMAKFDGNSWKVYDMSNSGLPLNDVETIAEDAQGTKWICMNAFGSSKKTLASFDEENQNWTIYNPDNYSDLPDAYKAITVAFDDKGKTWIGTKADGLISKDGNSFTVYKKKNYNIPTNRIRAIGVDDNNNIWAGGYNDSEDNGGLVMFDGNSFNDYSANLPSKKVTSIAIDNNGNKWIGTNDKGLVYYDGNKWKNYDASNTGLPSNEINDIAVDANGNTWICTDKGLAFLDANKNWQVFTPDNSGMPNDNPISIDFDDMGNKWIGTNIGMAKYTANIVTKLNERKINQKAINVYPNPATEKLKIESEYNIKSYELLSITGQRIKNGTLKGDYNDKIDISHAPSGVYLLKLKSKNNIFTQKLMIK